MSSQHSKKATLHNPDPPQQHSKRLRADGPPRVTRRAAAEQAKAEQLSPPSNIPHAIPSSNRKTRSTQVTCLDFGSDRRIRFPGSFFCSECDHFENEILSGKFCIDDKRPIRYRCKGKHPGPMQPAPARETALWMLNFIVEQTFEEDEGDDEKSLDTMLASDDDDDNDDDNNDEDHHHHDSIDHQLTAMENVDGHSTKLNHEIDPNPVIISSLKLEVKNLRRQLWTLKHGQQQSNKSHDRAQQVGIELLSMIQATRKKQDIIDAFFKVLWQCDDFRQQVVHRAKKEYTSKVFTPFNVAKAMDLHGSSALNLSAIECLRDLERAVAGVTKNQHHRSVLPSAKQIQICKKAINRVGQVLVPLTQTRSTSSNGEVAYFDAAKATQCILKGTGLDKVEDSQEYPIILPQAADGSSLSPQVGFVMQGVKICDRRAKDPWTKRELSKLQSRNYQIPLWTCIGPENDATYKEMSDCLETATGLQVYQGQSGSNTVLHVDTQTICTDMKASWKLLGRGGACKVAGTFCHLCAVKSTYAAAPNPIRCTRCASKGQDWKCYHQSFLDKDVVAKKQRELQRLLQQKPRFREMGVWSQNTRMKRRDDRTNASVNDFFSVHFEHGAPSISNDIRRQYKALCSTELEIRGITPEGDLSCHQSMLKQAIKEERDFLDLRDEVEHGLKGTEDALFGVDHNPPCILHLNMRVSIKMLTTVIRHGLSSAMFGHLDSKLFTEEERPSDSARYSRFKTRLEYLFNTEIFGDFLFPTNWRAPFDDKERVVLPLSLDNNKCCKAVEKAEIIVNLCLVQDRQPEKYINCFDCLHQTITLLGSKDNFDERSIERFQAKADEFVQLWLGLEGIEGMTNYVHMLAAGHISDYLRYHGNLYQFSNQGWEALNSMIKTFYHRRTTRGGGRHGARSRLRAIMLWIQRRFVYMTISSEEELQDLLESPDFFENELLEEDQWEDI